MGPCCSTKSGQAFSGQIFHDVVKRAVVGVAVIENFDGVPVRELGRGLNFAMETGDSRGFGAMPGLMSLIATGRFMS